MSRHGLTDEQWAIIEPLIPQQKSGPGRQRNDERPTLNGMLFVRKTGCTWEDVPRAYGSPVTCWRRFRAWSQDSAWERMWRMLLSQLDAQGQLEWAQALWDGSGVPATKGLRYRSDHTRQGLDNDDGRRWPRPADRLVRGKSTTP